jgi:hypothetical protein
MNRVPGGTGASPCPPFVDAQYFSFAKDLELSLIFFPPVRPWQTHLLEVSWIRRIGLQLCGHYFHLSPWSLCHVHQMVILWLISSLLLSCSCFVPESNRSWRMNFLTHHIPTPEARMHALIFWYIVFIGFYLCWYESLWGLNLFPPLK